MIKKNLFTFLSAILAIFCLLPKQSIALTFTEFVYNNAKTDNLKNIQVFLQRGYNIDAIDSKGFTALCYSIENNDYNAYENLKKLGANTNHHCTQRILSNFNQEYAEFTKSNKSNFNQKYTRFTQNHQTKVASKNNNSLKIGATIIGASGIAALLASGGGSGSSKPSNKCPAGYELIDNECHPKNCGTEYQTSCNKNQYTTGKTCQSGDIILTECKPLTQSEGCLKYSSTSDRCIECDSSYLLYNNVCYAKIECPDNFKQLGNNCIADGNIEITNTSNENFYGVSSNFNSIYNLLSTYGHPDDFQEIKLKNSGLGEVYGMYGLKHVTNAYVSGQKSNAEINPVPSGLGIITIENQNPNNTKNVYGLYAKIDNPQNSWEASNAYAVNSGTATGIININNKGTGNTYGIFGDDRAYNAFSATQGNAYGNINIEGNGNIYGIGGYVAAINASSYQASWYNPSHTGKSSVGNINIKSTGDGDIYGMHVSKGYIETDKDDNTEQWFAINAAGDYKDIIEGNINITNQGSGNVYGMYGGKLMFNGVYWGVENGKISSKVVANINILNEGTGNVYGMYSPEKHAEIYNINVPGYDKQTGVTSNINLINTGDGITTGIRGGEQSTIQNTGTININNLGNGTAIGMYGDKNSKIENKGTINIYRKEYKDNTTDKTYTPTSEIGGTAYGIYAKSGSTVLNTGTINITNTQNGTGIYLENDAILLNDGTMGTVTFNGTSQEAITGEDIDIYQENNTETVLNLNAIGDGKVVLGTSGKFFAETIKGDLLVTDTPIYGNFKNSHEFTSSLEASNISELSINSKSAMFTAYSKENTNNQHDIILTRTNFNDLIKDKNIAEFLELNYNNENNLELYDNLKQAKTTKELTKKANSFTGKDILPAFKREDSIIYNNISHELNNNLFNKPDENYIVGYKYIDISNKADNTLQESNGTASVAYGLLKSKSSTGINYGIGANITQLKTDYDNNSTRDSKQFGLWLPIGYKFDNGINWFSKLYGGYANNSYDRITELGKKTATYDEYQFGISNEVRYNLDLSNNITFSPLAELNYLNLYQDNINENSSSVDTLKINSHNSSSIELGLGAYLTKEFFIKEQQKLTIQIGGIYYIELLNPDKPLNASIKNMDYKLKIHNPQNNNHGSASLRATYNYNNLLLYGNIEKDFGTIDAFSLDAGIQYAF